MRSSRAQPRSDHSNHSPPPSPSNPEHELLAQLDLLQQERASMPTVPGGFSPISVTRPPEVDHDPPPSLGRPIFDDTSHHQLSTAVYEPTTTTTGLTHSDMPLTFDFDFASVEFSGAKPKQSELDFTMPFDFQPFPSSALSIQAYAAFDQTLDSPLGLDDTPFSEYLVSPMFDDCPDFDPTSSQALFPLFPPQSLPQSLPSLPAFLPALPSTSAVPPTPSTPSLLTKKSPPTRSRSTPAVVPLDAPIAPRNYLLPSATSRKHKTTAVERELAKRKCLPNATGEQEIEIPEDLVAAVENKRRMNTMAARKSRARKQGRLQELEDENETLKGEKEVLERRVADLEAILKGVVGA